MAYSQDNYGKTYWQGRSLLSDDNRGNGQVGVIVGVAAAGFAAGMAASMARKMAAQAPASVKGDWIEALKMEHRIIEKLFDQLVRTSDDDAMKRTALLKTIKGGLAKHDLEESSVIYPALRLHGSEEASRHLSEDHADIKTFLLELDTLEKTDPSWIERARAFQELVMAHVREEEDEIFPSLRLKLSKQENDKLFRMTQIEAIKLA